MHVLVPALLPACSCACPEIRPSFFSDGSIWMRRKTVLMLDDKKYYVEFWWNYSNISGCMVIEVICLMNQMHLLQCRSSWPVRPSFTFSTLTTSLTTGNASTQVSILNISEFCEKKKNRKISSLFSDFQLTLGSNHHMSVFGPRFCVADDEGFIRVSL